MLKMNNIKSEEHVKFSDKELLDTLDKYFGYKSFRTQQKGKNLYNKLI